MFQATQSTWFLIGWIAKLLGFIMDWIFEFLNAVGIPNIGLAIILFTVVTKLLMLPMTIRQQKFSKLSGIMQPELQAIQDKYKGKQDSASMMAMQEETKVLYGKYGTSPTSGCLQLLIQMPIMLALYQVILKLPGYITRIKEYYGVVADKLMGITGFTDNTAFTEFLTKIKSQVPVANMISTTAGVDAARNNVIDLMYSFSQGEWSEFLKIFNNSEMTSAYNSVADSINRANSFLGIDLSMTPLEQISGGVWWAVFIPLLAGGFQFLSTKLISANQPNQKNNENSAAGTMKTMNIIMPIISVVFCFSFSAGLGVYWVASALVQVIVQVIVDAYVNKTDIEGMIQKNVDKMNEKRIKKGLPPVKKSATTVIVKNIEEQKQAEAEAKKALADQAQISSQYYETHTTARKGSLAEKAGMVQQYEERMKQQKSGKKE